MIKIKSFVQTIHYSDQNGAKTKISCGEHRTAAGIRLDDAKRSEDAKFGNNINGEQMKLYLSYSELEKILSDGKRIPDNQIKEVMVQNDIVVVEFKKGK